MTEAIIALTKVSKSFGTTRALRNMSLELCPGEVHVLLGENGAGKSTLVNTLIGKYVPDAGTITLRGKQIRHYSPRIAHEHGINVVFQDFALAPTLPVADNLFLGHEIKKFGLVDKNAQLQAASKVLRDLRAEFSPTTEVGLLTRAEQQQVEIAKGLLGRPGALLLDEPTASISDSESERLFEIVDGLRQAGWAILYITHRLEEMQRLGDRVTVMRDGSLISTQLARETTHDKVIADMVGRSLNAVYPPKAEQVGDVVLDVQNLSTVDGKVRGVDLHVRRGEVVGLAGLVGCGKSDVARAVMGVSKLHQGTILVDGSELSTHSPAKSLRAGIGYMPEDRSRQALAVDLSVQDNIALEVFRSKDYSTAGITRGKRVQSLSERLVEELDIRPRSVVAAVGNLSGGNQQKVVLGRALTRHRKVYVFVEPTAGVDIGSRQEIYAHVRRLCSKGAGVLLISSDIEELVGMSDRVYVMNAGAVTAELQKENVNHESIVAGAFDHTQEPTPIRTEE